MTCNQDKVINQNTNILGLVITKLISINKTKRNYHNRINMAWFLLLPFRQYRHRALGKDLIKATLERNENLLFICNLQDISTF